MRLASRGARRLRHVSNQAHQSCEQMTSLAKTVVPPGLTIGNGKQRRQEVAEENIVPACCRIQQGYEADP